MDQPKIERLLRLMKLLTSNTTYSVDQLAERLSMSRRTIYRYIESFREAGFVIKKSGDCIRLDKESPHFKDISQLVHFTEEEAIILKRAIESVDNTNILKQNLKRKLYSIYDNKVLADTVVKGPLAGIVHTLIEAIENQKQVILKGYRSANSSRVSDRRVEPFSFTTNYINIWCYDIESKSCKSFKTARIDGVELLNTPFEFSDKHQEGFTDIFRMNGDKRYRVKLELGLRAYNLIMEEYPLSENYLTQTSNNLWLLDVEVAGFMGVGRFVAGLLDDISIIEGEELKSHIVEYFCKFIDNQHKNSSKICM